MSKPFDFDTSRQIIETSLKYDDHNPQHRRELEEYLTRDKQRLKLNKQMQNKVAGFYDFKKKRAKVPAGRTMNIDISLPPELTKFLEDKS